MFVQMKPEKGVQEKCLFIVGADDEVQVIRTPEKVNKWVERADLVKMGCHWSAMVVST